MINEGAVLYLCGLSCIIGIAVGYVIGYWLEK